MEVIQPTTKEQSRAKEIDTGAVPLPMSNVLLGLPIKPTTVDQVDRSAVKAQPWTWQDLVSQPKHLSDINVTSTSTGIVYTFRNTWNNVQNLIFRKLDPLFTLKSWTVKLDFEFRSNFQQVGQFVLFYSNLPPTLNSFHFGVTEPYTDYALITQLPHRKIPMGEDVNCCVLLKWISPFKSAFGNGQYLPAGDHNSSNYDMGTLHLSVPFKMEAAQGVVANTTVRVWASLVDVSYSGYAPSDTVI
ncbi:putative capsid protein [Colobopsis shohki virus 1]|nr:putative capsid protein [Colobopsis shohki virus 1]